MPSLLNMPEVVLSFILEKLDFKSIQNLRKSCRDLRHFIDDVKPESGLSDVEISVHSKNVHIFAKFHKKIECVSYQWHEKGCLVRYCEIEKILENSTFLDVAWKDIHLILSASGVLKSFEVELFTDLENLHFREAPVRTKNFKMTFTNPNQVLAILPNLDPRKLEKISLKFDRIQYGDVFDFSEISHSDHWNSAKKLVLENFITSLPISSFSHFQRVSLHLGHFSSETVLDLREVFFKNPTMKYFGFRYYVFVKYNQFKTDFGEAFRNSEKREDQWFFEIVGDSGNVLSLSIWNNSASFQRIDRGEVPVGAVVNE